MPQLLEGEVVVSLAMLEFMEASFQPVLGLAKLLDRGRFPAAGFGRPADRLDEVGDALVDVISFAHRVVGDAVQVVMGEDDGVVIPGGDARQHLLAVLS